MANRGGGGRLALCVVALAALLDVSLSATREGRLPPGAGTRRSGSAAPTIRWPAVRRSHCREGRE